MENYKYKNLNLCAFADEADENFDEQIIALKENDINLLEIRGVNGKNISELTIQEVKEAKNKLDDTGIKVWAIGSPIGKVDINAPFQPHLDLFSNLLDTANLLNASHFRLFSFYGVINTQDVDKENLVFERLNTFVEKSSGRGVQLCHENEKDIYGDIASRCLKIHQQIPAIKAVFDPANFINCSQDVPEAWEILKPYVEYLHIKDALKTGRVVPAGHGIGNIQTILDDFSKINGTTKYGTLTLEPHLFEFVGLKELSGNREEANVGSLAFSTSREAFDAAANALKKLLI